LVAAYPFGLAVEATLVGCGTARARRLWS